MSATKPPSRRQIAAKVSDQLIPAVNAQAHALEAFHDRLCRLEQKPLLPPVSWRDRMKWLVGR